MDACGCMWRRVMVLYLRMNFIFFYRCTNLDSVDKKMEYFYIIYLSTRPVNT